LTAGLTAALVTVSLTGVWFNTTRAMSIAALAMLCFLHPWLTVLVAAGVAWAFIYFKVRKS
jgi:DUF1365 family protein